MLLNELLAEVLLLELRGVLDGSATDEELRELLVRGMELLERLTTLLLDATALQTAPVMTGF
jgi:hypothetical protein